MKRDVDWIIKNRLTQRKFDRLPKEEQRVYIARDVLAQMQLKHLKPEEGVYLASERLAYDRLKLKDQTRDFGALLDAAPCTACAIGSLFACAVKVADRAPAASFLGQTSGTGRTVGAPLKSYLDRFFTREQQALIEAAFEGADISSQCADAGVDVRTIVSAMTFNRGFKGAKTRMTRIMRNIIRNGGDFDPRDATLATR